MAVFQFVSSKFELQLIIPHKLGLHVWCRLHRNWPVYMLFHVSSNRLAQETPISNLQPYVECVCLCTGVACDCTNDPFTHCSSLTVSSVSFTPLHPRPLPHHSYCTRFWRTRYRIRERDRSIPYPSPHLQNTVTVSKDRAYPSLSMASTVCPRTIRFASPKKKSLSPFMLCFTWMRC